MAYGFNPLIISLLVCHLRMVVNGRLFINHLIIKRLP